MKNFVFLIFVFALGCIDFGWLDSKIECERDRDCPEGLYCELGDGRCRKGPSPNADLSCTGIADCPTVECGTTECVNETCQYTPANSDCGGGEICAPLDDNFFQCENPFCEEPALTDETSMGSGFDFSHWPSVVATKDGFAAAWCEYEEGMGFAKFDSAGQLIATHINPLPGCTWDPILTWLEDDNSYIVAYYTALTPVIYDVYVERLDDTGNPTGSTVKVSDAAAGTPDDNDSSSVHVAFAPNIGGAMGTLGLVWIYTSDTTMQGREIWGRTVDVETLAMGPAFMLVPAQGTLTLPRVVYDGTKFIAVVSDDSGQVLARSFDAAGALGRNPQVLYSADAYWPLSLAVDNNNQLGLAWRHANSREHRLVTLDNETLMPINPDDFIVLGGTNELDLGYATTHLSWHDNRWYFAWNFEPGATTGSMHHSEIHLTSVDPTTGIVAQPWQLSNDLYRSMSPHYAMADGPNGKTLLILWHDNRDNPVPEVNGPDFEYDGTIYYRAISCL